MHKLPRAAGFRQNLPAMLLLHLSDLHFGAHSRFRELEPARFAEGFLAQLKASRERLGIAAEVDLVIATGDFAETGHPKEFEQAGAFLGAVVDGLRLPRRRAVLLPGNHDVSWLHCKKAEIDQQLEGFDDDELRRRFEETKFLPFQEFTTRFYGDAGIAGVAMSLRTGALLYRYPEQRLAVAALNSCERETHRRADHVGMIGPDQAKSVMDALRTGDGMSWLKIVAVHHNPDVTVRANLDAWADRLRSELAVGADVGELIARYQGDALGFEGGDRLKAIAEDCSVQLVLHGHHHARDAKTWNGGRSHVLSAGSLALAADKLPREEPASVRLIEIDPEAPEIRSWCLTYAPQARIEGEVDRGAFTPDQADPDGRSFVLALPPGFLQAPAARPAETAPGETAASFLVPRRLPPRLPAAVPTLGPLHARRRDAAHGRAAGVRRRLPPISTTCISRYDWRPVSTRRRPISEHRSRRRSCWHATARSSSAAWLAPARPPGFAGPSVDSSIDRTPSRSPWSYASWHRSGRRVAAGSAASPASSRRRSASGSRAIARRSCGVRCSPRPTHGRSCLSTAGTSSADWASRCARHFRPCGRNTRAYWSSSPAAPTERASRATPRGSRSWTCSRSPTWRWRTSPIASSAATTGMTWRPPPRRPPSFGWRSSAPARRGTSAGRRCS